MEIENHWQYKLAIINGKTPEEARRIVLENRRRVRKEIAIGNAIFDREMAAVDLERVGLRTGLFSRDN